MPRRPVPGRPAFDAPPRSAAGINTGARARPC
jgi:hypothetical protein